jgi:hypothetical protein
VCSSDHNMLSSTSTIPKLDGEVVTLSVIKKPTETKKRRTKIICTLVSIGSSVGDSVDGSDQAVFHGHICCRTVLCCRVSQRALSFVSRPYQYGRSTRSLTAACYVPGTCLLERRRPRPAHGRRHECRSLQLFPR